MTPLRAAPAEAPESIRRGLALAAEAWFEDPDRPRLTPEIVDRWQALLGAWSAAEDMPLLVRKARGNRGHAILHATGRMLVPADNSPAHWSLALAHAECCPSIDEVRDWWRDDRIPVAMVLGADERVNAVKRCTRQSVRGPNALGWKVAHIDDVGLGYSASLDQIPIGDLKDHFIRFLSPANMFLVPKEYAGVAEAPEFIAMFRSRVHDT